MITYVTDAYLDLKDLLPLYEAVGWTSYSQKPDILEAAIKGSRDILVAYDEDQLVGLIRTVGDGVSIIFVQDILVLPDYQRQGIGRSLLQAILDKIMGFISCIC